MAGLGSLYIDLVARTGKFETDMGKAAKLAEKRAKEIDRAVKQAGLAIGAALVTATAAIAASTKKAIDDMDALAKAAQRVGTSVEELSGLEFAANLSGVTNLEGGLKALNRAIGNAAGGNKELLQTFSDLGVKVVDANGNIRKTTEVMRDLADKFRTLPDGPEKSFAATRLRISELLPMLNQGSDGIAALTDEAARLGLVVDTQTAKAAEQFNDNLTRLQSVTAGFSRQLAAELLPDLVKLTNYLAQNAGPGGYAAQLASGIRSLGNGFLYLRDTIEAALNYALLLNARIDQIMRLAPGLKPLAALADKMGGGGASASSRAASASDGLNTALGSMANRWMGTQEAASGGNAGTAFAAIRDGIMQVTEAEKARRIEAEKIEARLAASRTAEEKATAAKAASAAASRAAAAAEKERERILSDGARAAESLNGMLREQAGLIGGEAVQAANAYADRMLAIAMAQEKLAAANMLDAEAMQRLSLAREQETSLYQRQIDAINATKSAAEDFIEQLEFELSLMFLSNEQREKEIALRMAGADATDAQREQVIRLTEKRIDAQRQLDEMMKREREHISQMDGLRDTSNRFFESLLSNTGKASDAFKAMADDIVAQINRMIAQKWTEQLFGASGTTAGGSAGGWASAFMSMFGGGRAHGGPVYPNKTYMVNEREPEFFRPSSGGDVIPLSKMPTAGGVTVNVNVPPSIQRKTADQVAMRTAERLQISGRNR